MCACVCVCVHVRVYICIHDMKWIIQECRRRKKRASSMLSRRWAPWNRRWHMQYTYMCVYIHVMYDVWYLKNSFMHVIGARQEHPPCQRGAGRHRIISDVFIWSCACMCCLCIYILTLWDNSFIGAREEHPARQGSAGRHGIVTQWASAAARKGTQQQPGCHHGSRARGDTYNICVYLHI